LFSESDNRIDKVEQINKVEDRPQTIGDFARLIMSSKASTK